MSASFAWLRRLALGMLLFVLLFAMLTARVLVEGEAELRKSDAAFDRGELRDAILYARRSATLYAPGAPHVGAAYARLEAIAVGSEASSQTSVAEQAWGAMRGAALESRHFWNPHARELALANASLARLQTAAGAGRSRAVRLLSRDDAPRATWIIVLGAGFGLFLAGLGLAVRQGLGPEGRLNARILALSGLIALLGVACWTLAVFRA